MHIYNLLTITRAQDDENTENIQLGSSLTYSSIMSLGSGDKYFERDWFKLKLLIKVDWTLLELAHSRKRRSYN